MPSPNRKFTDQSGSAMVEVIVSAVLMIVIAVSVFGALEASGRAGAQERLRARAFAIAQEDQARMRSLKVSEVTRLSQSRPVFQDGRTYTVASTGLPKLDRTATSACESGNSSADYVAIKSEVTWTDMGGRPPVVIESIIAPPNGSLETNRGALGVSVVDSRNNPYPSLTIAGSGAASFSGATTATGCVIFGDLPVGNYNVTAAAPSVIDANGVAPAATPTSVVNGVSNTLSLQYDRPSGFTVGFTTIKGGATGLTPQPTSHDRIRVFNTGMTQSRGFGTIGTIATTQKATTLFPFTSPYAVWAGACDANKPLTASAALGSYTVPVGQTAPTAANFTIQLPSLDLTVWKGTSSSSNGGASGSATIKITDEDCPAAGTRTFRTTSTGKISTTAAPTVQAFQGLPYGDYDICVGGTATSGTRRVLFDSVDIIDPTAPIVLNAYLSATAATSGHGASILNACP